MSHRYARLTPAGRRMMIERIKAGMPQAHVAAQMVLSTGHRASGGGAGSSRATLAWTIARVDPGGHQPEHRRRSRIESVACGSRNDGGQHVTRLGTSARCVMTGEAAESTFGSTAPDRRAHDDSVVTYLVAAPVDSVLRGVPWQTSVLMLSWSAPASVGSGLSDLNHEVLEALGLFDDLEFVPVDDFYEIRGQLVGEPLTIPHGFDTVVAVLTDRFPSDRGQRSANSSAGSRRCRPQ